MTANPSLPRCWGDGSSALIAGRPVECQAVGYPPLGLCARCSAEIIPGWTLPTPQPS